MSRAGEKCVTIEHESESKNTEAEANISKAEGHEKNT